MQVMSMFTDVGTLISWKSTRCPSVPESPASAAALSRSWACCKRRWFRRWPRRRRDRMASTWSRLQRHGAFAEDPAPPGTPHLRQREPLAQAGRTTAPIFLEPGLRGAENTRGEGRGDQKSDWRVLRPGRGGWGCPQLFWDTDKPDFLLGHGLQLSEPDSSHFENVVIA